MYFLNLVMYAFHTFFRLDLPLSAPLSHVPILAVHHVFLYNNANES